MKLTLTILAAVSISASAFAGERIEGRVTHVRDVDTIEVSNRPIRLNGVDGPEINERVGKSARVWMQKLVLHQRVRCSLNSKKAHDRWVGICYLASGEDIGALAITAGHARDCPRYSKGRYAQFETEDNSRHKQHSYCKKR